MTQPVSYVDAEGAVRTWARAQATLTDVVGPKGIFFGVPKGRALPLISMAQLDALPDGSETNVESVDITSSCWGRTKSEAAWLKARLKTVAQSMKAGYLVNVTDEQNVVHVVRFDGARVLRDIWLPDTSTDPATARYVVDIRFFLHALS